MMNAVLCGMSVAGHSHDRLDVGEVASEKPRFGTLSRKLAMSLVGCAALMSATAVPSTANGAPQHLDWIDVEPQIQTVDPTPVSQSLSAFIEGLYVDSESSAPFSFWSVAPGFLLIFR